MNFPQVFDKVRDVGGDWRSKIVPVQGDIAEENLGLSDEDWEMLQEDVEIVFHSAATVRFDEDLKWVWKGAVNCPEILNSTWYIPHVVV